MPCLHGLGLPAHGFGTKTKTIFDIMHELRNELKEFLLDLWKLFNLNQNSLLLGPVVRTPFSLNGG